MDTREILEHLFGGRVGYVFFPYSVPQSEGRAVWKESRAFLWPTEADAITEHLSKGGVNQYFSPQMYKYNTYRRTECLYEEQEVLWADLDECDVHTVYPKPTIAWESSPGRYAALWRLDKPYPLDDVLRACKGIAYEYAPQGADKGGWDATQVLRFPGTRNYKRNPEGDPGRLLWANDTVYSITDFPIAEEYTDYPDVTDTIVSTNIALPEWVRQELKRETLPPGADRSAMLWRLEHAMLEAGLPVMDIVALLWPTVWNKYKQRRDGKAQLVKEVLKCEKEYVEQGAIQEVEEGESVLPEKGVTAYDFPTFLSQKLSPPRWQVDRYWTLNSLGMIAGEPKAYKSILATDLALSVASMRPFLDVYPVYEPGPVLYINEENDAALVQDRIFKMAAHKGLLDYRKTEHDRLVFLRDIPLYVQNNEGFDLVDYGWRDAVEEFIKDKGISMLILDPFYMMLGEIDENDSSEVRPILRWLSSLRQKYMCSVLLVHHYNKSGSEKQRPGLRIRGSSVFHGWLENGLYVTRQEVEGKVKVEKEYRAFQGVSYDYVTFILNDPGQLGYTVNVGSAETTASLIKERIIYHMVQGGRDTITAPELVERYGGSLSGTHEVLNMMVDEGLLTVLKQGRGRGSQTLYGITDKLARLRQGLPLEDEA